MPRHLAALVVFFAGLVAASPASASRASAAPVEVEWNGHWYAAEILARDGDQMLVHYSGYSADWDEWVSVQRVRIHGSPPVIARGQWRAGDVVEVEWNGVWYAAEVLTVRGDQALIHYAGYGSHWDEWVGDRRIR